MLDSSLSWTRRVGPGFNNRRHVLCPSHECFALLAGVGSPIVNARHAPLRGAAHMVDNSLDHVRLNAELVHARDHAAADVVNGPRRQWRAESSGGPAIERDLGLTPPRER